MRQLNEAESLILPGSLCSPFLPPPAMTPFESRGTDRSVQYTMTTSRPAAHSHARSLSHTTAQSYRPSKSGTPSTSPRPPHSAGQPYLTPAAVSRTPLPQDGRAPSPNYFGLIVEPAAESRESAQMPHTNWSPPSSSVKSFAAAIPQQLLPLDSNPDFDAFKRQADVNRSGSYFSLHGAGSARNSPSTPLPTAGVAAPTALLRPRPPPRWHTIGSDVLASGLPKPRLPAVAAAAKPGDDRKALPDRMDVDADVDASSARDSAYASAESKRNSEASLNLPSLLGSVARHESPVQFQSPFESRTSTLSSVEDRHPRLSVTQGRTQPPVAADAAPKRFVRAGSVPTKPPEAGVPDMMTAAELRDVLESTAADDVLLLDVRVSTHYAASRIQGALNLCVPTTLLKRATFDLHKLQQTFQSDEQRASFTAWRDKRYLVVYDSSSVQTRDAVAATNMLKKFTNEGYAGDARVLLGGYTNFAAAYPDLVDHNRNPPASNSPPLNMAGGRRLTLPLVIGGVALPGSDADSSKNKPEAFFSNIRQNMDLADGVGRMDLTVPPTLDPLGLPRWLRDAAEPADHGKAVSDSFLRIELAEQARMKAAYSLRRADDGDNVQLSGIEKGVKNRYKDILPFEHARVRLGGRVEGECDYVNASHVKASRSNKRYIASQGPLPATFEDFWSVIWDQDVRVIVMLTAESEGGQLKCHPYWTGGEYGPVKLRLLSEKKVSLDIDKHRQGSTASPASAASSDAGRRRANTMTTLEGSTPTAANPGGSGGTTPAVAETSFVIVRKFALSHAAYPFAPIREVTHLHYSSWPDFGAPAQPSHLLALVELANVMQRAALPVDAPLASGPGPSVSRSLSSSLGVSSATKPKPDVVSLDWFDEPESDAAARPMLVHCSAGCGRTGTFCTVDSVIDMLKRVRVRAVMKARATIERQSQQLAASPPPQQRQDHVDGDGDLPMDDDISPMTTLVKDISDSGSSEPPSASSTLGPDDSGLNVDWLADDAVDLVARTVEDFRTQRLSMVQSLRQYVLCYEAVAEWVWRLQERAGLTIRGRGRSGSLHVRRM